MTIGSATLAPIDWRGASTAFLKPPLLFFEFPAKHSSTAVCEMFRGFSGYIQADAHAIYHALFRGDAVDDPTRRAPAESDAPSDMLTRLAVSGNGRPWPGRDHALARQRW